MEFAVLKTKIWLFSVRISALNFSSSVLIPTKRKTHRIYTAKSVLLDIISLPEHFRVYASVLHVSLLYLLVSKIGPYQKMVWICHT